jgi:PadR family transcriptional regulator PadR
MKNADRIITRMEEFLLLAILKLGDNAVPISIYDEIAKAKGSSGTLGSIYFPLQRLEERGLVTSSLGESSPERGGKSRRYYHLTDSAITALAAARKVQEEMWTGLEWVMTR